jgi:hypothetical protein
MACLLGAVLSQLVYNGLPLFDAQEPHISDGLTSSSSKLREAQLPSEAGTVTGRR